MNGVPVPAVEGHSWVVFSTKCADTEGKEQEEVKGSLVDKSPEPPAEAGAADAGSERHPATLPDLPRVLVTFTVSVCGVECKCLIDSGASEDFIDRNLVTAVSLQAVHGAEKRKVKLANGTMQDASFKCSGVGVRFVSSGYVCDRDFLVTPLGSYGLILGKPWLTQVNP